MERNLLIFIISIFVVIIIINIDSIDSNSNIKNGHHQQNNITTIENKSIQSIPSSSSSSLPITVNQVSIQSDNNTTTISTPIISTTSIENNIQPTATIITTTTLLTHHYNDDDGDGDKNDHNGTTMMMMMKNIKTSTSTTSTTTVPTTTTTTTSTTTTATMMMMNEKLTKKSHKNKWSVNSEGNHNQLPYRLNCSMDKMTIQVNLSSLYGPTLSNSSRNQMANDEPYVYLEKLRSFSSKFFFVDQKWKNMWPHFSYHYRMIFIVVVQQKFMIKLPVHVSFIIELLLNPNMMETGIGQRSIYFKCSQPNLDQLLGFKVETSPLDDDDDQVGNSSTQASRIKRESSSSSAWIQDSNGRLVNFTEIDLPENFMEAEVLDFTDNITARAPYPHLNLKVKRNGRFVNQSLNVAPGTPLEMIIYLDDESKHVYGLLASFMKVTDNSNRQQEVIVLNGCSIDPYIFGNFISNDGGDSISARFRAFKFPESNYVMFIGTVNVCLDKCQEVPCGNGIYALGRRRRRRSLPMEMPKDPNKVFEIEMMAYLRIGYSDEELAAKHIHRQSIIQATVTNATEMINTESIKNSPIVAHLIDDHRTSSMNIVSDAQFESLTSSSSSSLMIESSIFNNAKHYHHFIIVFMIIFRIIFYY
ncbi:hypothetical protein DERF_010736 [Dermatophagoides farinae]|uniref:ZP domain-containing protein n=1 Tax=Dermatophagoides farinae TaxID=6954 RepID=A0A922L438_DERFA|nr:hypothetical protein DERF_010736 [Dermatophagoides farinae]